MHIEARPNEKCDNDKKIRESLPNFHKNIGFFCQNSVFFRCFFEEGKGIHRSDDEDLLAGEGARLGSARLGSARSMVTRL